MQVIKFKQLKFEVISGLGGPLEATMASEAMAKGNMHMDIIII